MTTQSILLSAYLTGAIGQHNPININAPVFSRATIFIKANPRQVWEKLADIDNWNQWLTTVSRSKLNGVLAPNATFDWKTGSYHIHSILRLVQPYSALGWTGKVYGIYAVHNWTFRAVEGGTEVEVTESMEGFLPRLFKRSFNKSMEKDMVQSLQLLKKACEF